MMTEGHTLLAEVDFLMSWEKCSGIWIQ